MLVPVERVNDKRRPEERRLSGAGGNDEIRTA